MILRIALASGLSLALLWTAHSLEPGGASAAPCDAPGWLTAVHAAFFFAGTACLFLALDRAQRLARGLPAPGAARAAWWAFGLIFAGGVPLGMAIQYHAQGVLWKGIPFGHDVSANKTEAALIFWGLAAIFLTRRPGRHAGVFALAAGLLIVALFLIPHSL